MAMRVRRRKNHTMRDEAREAGFVLHPIPDPDFRQLVEEECWYRGELLGLIDREGPSGWDEDAPCPPGYYAVTPDCRRLPGLFRRTLDAANALRLHAERSKP